MCLKLFKIALPKERHGSDSKRGKDEPVVDWGAASLDADYNVASSVSRRSTVNASWHQITSPRFGDKWMAPERPLKLGKIVAFNLVPQAIW